MTIEQIKKNIEVGDYITLGKALDITPENARMRFRRRKPDAVNALKKIVENREKLIADIRNTEKNSRVASASIE